MMETLKERTECGADVAVLDMFSTPLLLPLLLLCPLKKTIVKVKTYAEAKNTHFDI